MATVGYAKLPIPGGGDAPVGPGNLADLGLAIDPHLVQHVVDKAERDSQYASAPLHTVVSAENGSLWVKTSATANAWATVYEPLPAWRPVSLASGYQAGEFQPQVRLMGQRVHLRGRIVRTDGTVFPVSGVKIGDVPADCQPAVYASWAGGSGISGDPVVGVGRVEVLGNVSGSSLGGVGSIVWFSQDGSGVPWVDISGSYWKD
ncbi:hypothetical protein OG331_31720 [Streptomyces sp. NBC_01017]|uniref:hypothetical protein n=1 Tax=Streptomyces sp. NBC_01017 TaxID=2903721 RepID=UPI003867890B|nr:hypothetical protein OG331_31720 [Streptomyces sp. NBC_01017]